MHTDTLHTLGLRIGPIWKLASALVVDCHTGLCYYGHPTYGASWV